MTISTLPTNAIKPNEYNPNRMNPGEFAELISEIRHLGRLPKPVVVTPATTGYIIVDGEHSWRAACEVGLETVAAEIIEADDFESRRQTYKRNQHGEHNKVVLGRMFRDMMEQRGLSRCGLADEINVSEGTIRNALVYSDAAETYGDYARERGLDVDADNDVAALAIRQVRLFVKLPPALARLWLAEGAGLDVLTETPLAGGAADAESFAGLFEFVPPATGATFQNVLRQMIAWHALEQKLTQGLEGYRLTVTDVRPYLRHHFEGDFFVREKTMIERAMHIIVDPTTSPPGFHLTPDEFSARLHQNDDETDEGRADFIENLALAVQKKSGTRPVTSGTQKELTRRALEERAPAYIRESNLHDRLKYLLWEADGLEDAKRVVANLTYIPGIVGTDEDKIIVRGAVFVAEQNIEAEAEKRARAARYETTPKAALATELAHRLFGEEYKNDRAAMNTVAAALTRLRKGEILFLDERIATEPE